MSSKVKPSNRLHIALHIISFKNLALNDRAFSDATHCRLQMRLEGQLGSVAAAVQGWELGEEARGGSRGMGALLGDLTGGCRPSPVVSVPLAPPASFTSLRGSV